MKAGVRSVMKTGGRTRHDFQQAHGFRKRFRTLFPASACAVHGQGDAETLMGHIKSYEKPTLDHLESVYLAAMPAVLIEEKYSLKVQILRQDQVHASKLQETRLDVLEERTKRQDFEVKVAQQSKDLARLRELYAELKRPGVSVTTPQEPSDLLTYLFSLHHLRIATAVRHGSRGRIYI